MPLPRLSRSRRPEGLRATERWFVTHGLPYLVPAERARARAALRPRRMLPLLVATVVGAIVAASLLTWLLDDPAYLPATPLTVGILAAAGYAVTAMRGRPILTWAVSRTLGSLRQLLPMVTRALPLLLVFLTFLFINAEVWQVAANLDGGVMWLTVLLFTALGIGFFVARLPEEVDRVDDELDADRIASVCRGTPMEDDAARLARSSPAALVREVTVRGFERANLMGALLVTQTTQVLILAASVFGFFLLFGAITMKEEVVVTWIGEEQTRSGDLVPSLSIELLQVSLFLAAFSGLYFTVYAVTDETYRDQFFVSVRAELERALAMRAAYTLVRAEQGEPREEAVDDEPAGRPSRGLARQDDAPTRLVPRPDAPDDPSPTVQLRRPDHDERG